MSSAGKMRMLLIATVAFVLCAQCQSLKNINRTRTAQDQLVGAWYLEHIDASGPDGKPMPLPQPKGMLIYTRDGHMSVQLMYLEAADSVSNEYVMKGYEASFGSYNVNETAQTVTHHVQGSITRGLLVGQDLPRAFEFTPEGHLILRSTRPDEHWFVTWAHY